MVLVLNGVLQEDCPPDTRSLYHAHPVYRETAAQLLAIPNKVIGPVGLLYVQQRELAATVPHDSKYERLISNVSIREFVFLFCFAENVSILGSDDVTTCLIVVVRHSGKLKLLVIKFLYKIIKFEFHKFIKGICYNFLQTFTF